MHFVDCPLTEENATAQSTTIKDSKIDCILATEQELIPSSGFLASVMECVEEQAVAPPPIPFPWKRAVPGILLAAGIFVWGTVEMIRLSVAFLNSPDQALPQLSSTFVAPAEVVGWVSLAMGLSLISWLFSRRLAGTKGLS